jgi:hypothetical protein
MELEHARLLQQGWRLAEDGTYRKGEPINAQHHNTATQGE